MADNGFYVAMTSRFDPKDTEAILSIVECNTLDETGDCFLR